MRNREPDRTNARPPERRGRSSLVWEIGLGLGAYLKGQFTVAAILTVLYAIGFAACRLPLWFLVAPVCGALYFIPYFGYLIGLAIPPLVGWAFGLSFERIIAVVLVYIGINAVESFFLTPRIIGHRTGLRPLYVFLAVLVAGSGFGIIGLLLAVPILLVATILWRRLFTAELPRE